MPLLTWLHLSDVHLTSSTSSDWASLQRALLRDIREHRDSETALAPPRAGQVLRPDLIMLTGDLAQRGKPEEYDSVRSLIEQIWTITGLDRTRTFSVPGNHDVDRSVVAEDFPYATVRSALAQPNLSSEDLTRHLQQFWPSRELFLKKQSAYAKFVSENTALTEPHTYYVKTLRLPGLPKIEVIGLNTAWMADRDAEDMHRELILGLPQYDELVEQLNQDEPSVRIVLQHHPPDCLHQSDITINSWPQLSPILLHGHRHIAQIEGVGKSPDRW
jgi:3',5'-cyclic AMP phosphodiesterase CpdA